MNSYQNFNKVIRPAVQAKLGLKNINQAPTLDKVVVAIGVGSLATRKGMKEFAEFEQNLAKITGQKPQMILSKKAVSNFKLREGMPAMLKVTLRKKMAYDFLDRLNAIVMPRVRDFTGLSMRSFDNQGNYSIGIKNYNIFPELHVEDVKTQMGLQITIVPRTNNKQETKAFLEGLGFIFQEN